MSDSNYKKAFFAAILVCMALIAVLVIVLLRMAPKATARHPTTRSLRKARGPQPRTVGPPRQPNPINSPRSRPCTCPCGVSGKSVLPPP